MCGLVLSSESTISCKIPPSALKVLESKCFTSKLNMLTSCSIDRVKEHSEDTNNAFIPGAMSVYGCGPAFVSWMSVI